MRRFATFLGAALLSVNAWATTYVPIQLLNAAGSSSGQAVVSTGASSAPSWSSIVDSVIAGSGVTVSGATGNVTVSVATNGVALSQIAQVAANTVLGNATSATANVTALAVPSCSTSSSATQWTSASGWGCNTSINAATLVGATWASPPSTGYGSATPEPVAATTISATGLISPTSSIGIKGTATNDNPQAGSIGEFPAPTNLTNVSLTSGAAANVSSVSLSAGDWEISGVIQFNPAGTTVLTAQVAGINATSATVPALPNYSQLTSGNTVQAGIGSVVVSPSVRITLASTTTVYLIAEGVFTTSTCTASGWMHIRRPR